MNKKSAIYPLLITVTILFFVGCSTTPDPSNATIKSFKDYPDNEFDASEYVSGMKKGGHNLLIWQDPTIDLSKYNSVNINYFDGRLIPEKKKSSCSPFIKQFNTDFERSFKTLEFSSKSLRVEGAIVECNPGRPEAQGIFKKREDKTYFGVACEIYEPGASKPVIKIFTRDSARSGPLGGDADSLLNHIEQVLAGRLSAKIKQKVGR